MARDQSLLSAGSLVRSGFQDTDRAAEQLRSLGDAAEPLVALLARTADPDLALDTLVRLHDAATDVEAWLANKVADKFARVEGSAFTIGDGVGKARGLFAYPTAAISDDTRAWGTFEHVKTGTSSDFNATTKADPLFDLIGAFKPQYLQNTSFLMRREVFDEVAPSLSDDGFKILLDILVSAMRYRKANGQALQIGEVPYEFRQRHAGDSKMSPLIVIQFVGLWLSKLTGGLLPTSFLLFAMVGVSGVVVHLTVLAGLVNGIGVPFVAGQIVATLVAMTWNFFLNNSLTYADRRLHGTHLWTGLIGFYLVCSLGAIANISVAAMIYEFRHATLIAGLAGAIMSSVFNYAVTRMVTWRS